MPYKVYLNSVDNKKKTWIIIDKDIAFARRNLKKKNAGVFPASFTSLQWARRVKNILNAKKQPGGLKEAEKEIRQIISNHNSQAEYRDLGDYEDDEKMEGLKLALKIINKHCKQRN